MVLFNSQIALRAEFHTECSSYPHAFWRGIMQVPSCASPLFIAFGGWSSHGVLPMTSCEHGPLNIANVHFSKFSIATTMAQHGPRDAADKSWVSRACRVKNMPRGTNIEAEYRDRIPRLKALISSTESLGPCFSHGMGDHDQTLQHMVSLDHNKLNRFSVCFFVTHI